MEVTEKVKEVLARIDEPTFVATLELVFESADNLLSPSLLKSKRKLSSGERTSSVGVFLMGHFTELKTMV